MQNLVPASAQTGSLKLMHIHTLLAGFLQQQ
jgi:hypothetical protein